MPFRTRNFARLCAATALAAGATGFFAAPAFAAAPAAADFSIVTDDITGAKGAPLPPGSDAVVKTTIANASSVVITGFELSVTLPDGVTFKGAAADKYTACDYAGQTVTCKLADGWNLVPVGQEVPAEKIYSKWDVPFQVTIAEGAKGPKLTGGKSTGKITSAAEFETGEEAEIEAEAAEFVPAAFNGADSDVTLASFKQTPNHGRGGGDRWRQGGAYGQGGGGCGYPHNPTPTPSPSVPQSQSPSPSPSVPQSESPSPSPSASQSQSPSPSPSTVPPTTTPPATPPATPPVVHSVEFAALVAVPGGNGGGGEEPPLPNTGVQVGVIGGLGAAVVVAGAAMYMVARRRRIVTVAPGDGNSSL